MNRRGVHYGWVVVATTVAAGMTLLLTPLRGAPTRPAPVRASA